jgi:hypothetical protein
MHKKFRIRFGFSCSDNPKSKIHNPKWMGLVAIVLVLVAFVGRVESQQPNKFPRIGYLSTFEPAVESARAEGVRLAAMWMSRH